MQHFGNFEANVSGNVGFNLGLAESERLIRKLKAQKAAAEEEAKMSIDSGAAAITSGGGMMAPSLDSLKSMPSLLQIKSKPK